MAKIYNHITEDEKIKLARITQDCLDTHVMNPPKAFVNLAVLDRDGKEIERHELLSKSWTRNFYNLFVLGFFKADPDVIGGTYGDGSLKLKDQSGSVSLSNEINSLGYSSHTGYAGGFICAGPLSDTDYGILIGTGTSAESFNDYSLSAKILDGTTSGRMSYTAQNAPVFSWDLPNRKLSVLTKRFFNNNSGSSIIVGEVGYGGKVNMASYNATAWLINRDLLPAAVTVPNGGQLTVEYNFEWVFPS